VIFVSVGSQMPFDRLIVAVDEWAAARGRSDVVAQIGDSQLTPRYLRAIRFLSPSEFAEQVRAARALVSHAGTGTILAALEHAKPLLVFPRRAVHLETRNDHQVATARYFAESGRVLAAYDVAELWARLDEVESFGTTARIQRDAPPALLDRLREFVQRPG
jgi:UDP-N-acetylglucosamine transferase subunit ALG13